MLIELAEEHGVLALLAARLQNLPESSIPESARAKFQQRLRAQMLFTLAMTAELFHIFDAFEKVGIPTVLVKGPLLSLLAFGDPALRQYVDLDLIVLDRDILAAHDCLMQLGFDPDVPREAILAGKIPGEYLFKRPETRLLVELHTEKTFRYYPRSMPINDLFARARTVLLDGRPAPALSMEDELVLDSIHGAKHFWERLTWVTDIAGLIARQKDLDWNAARGYAADVGAERMLRVAVGLAHDVLGAQVPSAIETEWKADSSARTLCREITGWLPQAGFTQPPLLQRAIFRARMRGGLAGLAFLLRLSFSPTEEDWVEGKENSMGTVWDAVRRPFRLFRKYGSRRS